MKLIRVNILPIFLISILTFVVWYKTLGQTFLGEGYYYFDRNQDFFLGIGHLADIWQLDNQAKIFFDILPTFFGDNIFYYFLFQLFTIAIVNITFYFTILYFTKNKWVSFFAAIFFLGSYVGSFEMVGIGNYQRFIQRVPNVIPVFISLIYLGKFFELGKGKYLLTSFAIFTASVFLSHFTTFFLPIFIFYPIIWTLLKKIQGKAVLKAILISFVFLTINYLIASQGFHTSQANFSRPLSLNQCDQNASKCGNKTVRENQYIEQVVLQFANIVLPTFVTEKLVSVTTPYNKILIISVIPVILALLLSIFLLPKDNLKLKAFYLTCIICIPGILFLNLYVGKVDATMSIQGHGYYFLPRYYESQFPVEIKGDRYYYYPLFLTATALSISIWSFLSNKNKTTSNKYRFFVYLFLVPYLFYNINVIWKKQEALQPVSNDLLNYISYLKTLSGKLNNDTLVFVHPPFIWASQFARAFYGDSDTKFISISDDWEKVLKETKHSKFYYIDYDYQNKKIVDRTEEFLKR